MAINDQLPRDLIPAERALAKLAAAYPETVEDHPWDHRAFKIRGKTFVWLSGDAERFNVTVKLPDSGVLALELPFCQPSGYGLGKSGWVTASFAPGDEVPVGLIAEWLAESFAAVAPKRVVAAWRAAAPEPKPAAAKKPAAKKPAAKQPAAKQPAAKQPAAKKPAAKPKR